MAELKIDLNKDVSVGKLSRGKMPTKTSINLVPKKESILSTRQGVTSVIIGTLIVVVLVAFLIVRPIAGLVLTNAKVNKLTEDLDAVNAQIASMSAIEEEYAHYTYEDMTPEEMGRVDRVKIMKLVKDSLIAGGVARSWSLSGNVMTFEVSGASLSELNQIAAALEKESIVERCVIENANKGGTTNVVVNFVIYLQKSAEEGNQ